MFLLDICRICRAPYPRWVRHWMHFWYHVMKVLLDRRVVLQHSIHRQELSECIEQLSLTVGCGNNGNNDTDIACYHCYCIFHIVRYAQRYHPWSCVSTLPPSQFSPSLLSKNILRPGVEPTVVLWPLCSCADPAACRGLSVDLPYPCRVQDLEHTPVWPRSPYCSGIQYWKKWERQ